MVRFVLDMAKAEKWINVRQFVRRDGAIVAAHQRGGKHAAPNQPAPAYQPAAKPEEAKQHAAAQEEDYPALGFDYDALVMRSEFRPGSTTMERLQKELGGSSDPEEKARADELTREWLHKNWPALRAAKTAEEVGAAFGTFDEEVGGKLYDEKQERQAAAKRELVAAVERTSHHRRAHDPGRVSTEEEGRAWAAGGAHPEPVYHATTAGSAIMATGLKSRNDIRRDTGKRVESLGHGPEDTVSTTPSAESARKIAAMFAALAEAQHNPDRVRQWLDEHWIPLIPAVHRAHADREIRDSDTRGHGVIKRINLVSYYAGHDHPEVLVPAIMATPSVDDLKNIGVVKAYAHVDAMVSDRAITAGPGAGNRDPQLVESDMRHQADGRPSHSTAAHAKHLAAAHVGWDTQNKAEQGEQRFTSNTLTAVRFEPFTEDWRTVLAPKK